MTAEPSIHFIFWRLVYCLLLVTDFGYFVCVQRPPFYNFKMGIPLAAKRAFKLSTVAFIFSAILLEIIPHPFKCSIATKKFVAEQIVFFVASFAIFFSWELTHNLHTVGVPYIYTFA